MGKKIDMTGWKMWEHGVPDSLLTIIEEDKIKTKETGITYWKYICACGTHGSGSGTNIRHGNVLSCGCLRKINTRKACMKDLTNYRFGKAVALYPDSTFYSRTGVRWICKCDCGTLFKAMAAEIISGRVKSCGCLVSAGEELIKTILNQNNIVFSTQKIYHDLLSDTGYHLKFDFYINDSFLLEYDGEQHFQESNWGNTTLAARQKYDRMKDEYAKAHNIPLKRIPYWDLDKITLENIMDDTYLIN